MRSSLQRSVVPTGDRVLVVDDEDVKRATLAAALFEQGFEVVCASSAEAARAARDRAPQLAIVDLMLHGTNGFELARALRSSAPAVGVVLTSDYHFSPSQLARVDCGAIAFVPRPFEASELAAFLRDKLDERRRSAPPSARTV